VNPDSLANINLACIEKTATKNIADTMFTRLVSCGLTKQYLESICDLVQTKLQIHFLINLYRALSIKQAFQDFDVIGLSVDEGCVFAIDMALGIFEEVQHAVGRKKQRSNQLHLLHNLVVLISLISEPNFRKMALENQFGDMLEHLEACLEYFVSEVAKNNGMMERVDLWRTVSESVISADAKPPDH